jgi:hypothetical protein
MGVAGQRRVMLRRLSSCAPCTVHTMQTHQLISGAIAGFLMGLVVCAVGQPTAPHPGLRAAHLVGDALHCTSPDTELSPKKESTRGMQFPSKSARVHERPP